MSRKKKIVYKQIEPPKLNRADCPFYRVLKFANRKGERCLKQTFSYERALSFIQEQKQATEKDILLPVLVCIHNGYVRPAKYEYAIVQRVDEVDFCGYTLLRNSYGELVQHEVENPAESLKRWKMVYKVDMFIEEVFKVNGLDDKKDCRWIYNNLIQHHIALNGSFCKISVYGKRVVLEYDNADKHQITTKCNSEAIRLYNKLQELSERDKMNKILWCGLKK